MVAVLIVIQATLEVIRVAGTTKYSDRMRQTSTSEVLVTSRINRETPRSYKPGRFFCIGFGEMINPLRETGRRLNAVLLTGLLVSGCLATTGVSGLRASSLTPQTPLSQRDEANALRVAYALLDHELGLAADPKTLEQSLAHAAPPYDLMIVMLYQQQGTLVGWRASPRASRVPHRFAQDLHEATVALAHTPKLDRSAYTAHPDRAQLVVHLLHHPQTIPQKKELEQRLEPGVHAIALRQGDKQALVPASVPVTGNYSIRQTLQLLSQQAGLGPTGYLDPKTRVVRYETTVWTGTRQGRVVELYRMNQRVTPETLTEPLIEERLGLAGRWLLAHVNPTGRFVESQYDPASDTFLKDPNPTKPLQALPAIARLATRLNQREVFRPLITQMLNRYVQSMTSDGRGGSYVSLKGNATIAHNAFLILALAEWPEYPNRDALIRQLAQGIVHQQQPDGTYRTVFGELGTDRRINEDPGVAMVALMRAYQLLHDPAFLASAEHAFLFYRGHWWRNPNSVFIPWQAQANLLLYQATAQPRYADFTFEMTDWLLDVCQLTHPRYPDEAGGFTNREQEARPDTSSTATYLQGVNAAYQLAKLTKQQKRLDTYARAIRLGTCFLLLTQLTNEHAFFLKNPRRAIGGFRQSLLRNFQRIEYLQYAAPALIAASENGLFPSPATARHQPPRP